MPYRPETTDTRAEEADLETLAAELRTRGYKTVLATGNGRPPCLDVINPTAPALTERIYAQADSFWWAWAQVIASRDQPAAAADTIHRTLRIPGPHAA